jgi:hypothetical protein
MGILGGPYINRDSSLILELDAADKNSYVSGSTIWNDLSGNGNNAALTAATFSTSSNNAINFNRSNNTRAIVSSLNLSTTSAITINMWVKIFSFPSAGDYRFLTELSENYNSYSDSFFINLQVESSNVVWLTQDKGNIGYNAKNLISPLPVTGSWYHFTAVYDHSQAASNQRTLYINGQNQTNIGSTDGGATYNSANTNNFGNRPLYIGGRSTTSFSSDMDLGVFQIYNRPLSATEILQNYNAQKSRYL